MAKLQIPLNGSNLVNKDRQQAFNNALEDKHQIDCSDSGNVKSTPQESSPEEPSLSPGPQQTPSQSSFQQKESRPLQEDFSLSQALEHTYQHQYHTMEIHQQYLAQQTEYIQLITSVLDQQGKILDSNSGNGAAHMVETFQRTLDNFHAIREQGILVHQEFLQQQAAFSERYLLALEGSRYQHTQPPVKSQINPDRHQVTEWVVQQPPIIVDDYSPSKPDPARKITAPEPDLSEIKMPASQSSTIKSAELADALLHIVADKTGYPVEMLEMDMDLEADLGIDSIKRVEILGTLEELYPTMPAANTEVLSQTRTLKEILEYLESETASLNPDPQTGSEQPLEDTSNLRESHQSAVNLPDTETSSPEMTQTLLEIVAEKTGYPADMLELEMDMEADLGIDSIKRVEILGTMEERVPGLPSIEAETLGGLRTLGEIVDLMGSPENSASLKTPPLGEDKKKAEKLSLERTPVSLVTLPKPDRLVFTPDQNRPVILSNDGTELTPIMAELLKAQGWKVVIWSYPEDIFSTNIAGLPADFPVIHQSGSGKKGIEMTMDEIRTAHGKPAGFIHLHPPQQSADTLFSEVEEELIKQVFLVSGVIKTDLETEPESGRNLLLIVLRGDGTLGLKPEYGFLEGSGLAGLVKTLHWEWQDVFCRFIDLNRQLPDESAAHILLQEIRDPARGLVEVGIGLDQRQTIQRQY